jgi:hypothetical protein
MSLTSVAVAAAAAIAYRGVGGGGGVGGLFNPLGGQTSPTTPAAVGLFPPLIPASAGSTSIGFSEARQTTNQQHQHHHNHHHHHQQHSSSFAIHQLLGLDSQHSDDDDDDRCSNNRDVVVRRNQKDSRDLSPSSSAGRADGLSSSPQPAVYHSVEAARRRQYNEHLHQSSAGRSRALPGWPTSMGVDSSRSIAGTDDDSHRRTQHHHNQHQQPQPSPIVHAATALHSITAWRQNLQLAFTAAAAAAAVTQQQHRVPGHHHQHQHHPAITPAHVHPGFLHGSASASTSSANEHRALHTAAALANYDPCRIPTALMTSLPDSSDVNNTGLFALVCGFRDFTPFHFTFSALSER